MARDAQTAYNEIVDYISKNGGNYSDWYAGVATDPRTRLFDDHNVQEKGGIWIFRECVSEDHARGAEEGLLDLGCNGAPGGGINPRSVYAYRVTAKTQQ